VRFARSSGDFFSNIPGYGALLCDSASAEADILAVIAGGHGKPPAMQSLPEKITETSGAPDIITVRQKFFDTAKFFRDPAGASMDTACSRGGSCQSRPSRMFLQGAVAEILRFRSPEWLVAEATIKPERYLGQSQ